MTTSASDPGSPGRPDGGVLRTLGTMAGRGLATFLVVAGIGILGVRHHHRAARAKKVDGGPPQVVMEPVRNMAGLGTQRLSVDGIDLVVTRSWEAGSPAGVRGRLTRRNQSLGWEAVAGAPENLPPTVRSRPEFGFLCFLTPNRKVVGYALSPDGSGTRIAATELDLGQVARRAGRESAPPAPAERARLMPERPRLALSGGTSGSDLYLVVVPSGDVAAVGAEIRQRFERDGWRLEPWEAVVGPDRPVPFDGDLLVAHRGGQLCHAVISREDGDVLISYRFSTARPARVMGP